jgi:hexosaminidase
VGCKPIQEFKKKNEITSNHDLQTYFNMKLIPMLKKHNKRLMGWEEIIQKTCPKTPLSTRGEEVMKGYPGGALITAAKNGYNTVLSNGYYIDLMLSVDSHYLNDPLPKEYCSFSGRKARILGGGCYVERTCGAFEHRFKIWPRTAAIAERFK